MNFDIIIPPETQVYIDYQRRMIVESMSELQKTIKTAAVIIGGALIISAVIKALK
jgi:hypothetical protein